MNQNPSAQLSMVLPLRYECLCFTISLESYLNPAQKLLYTCKFFSLILLLFFKIFVQTFHLHQVSVAQCLRQQTTVVKVAGSIHLRIFHVTPRCLLVQYSVYPLVIENGLWLSGLSCLFLFQNWPML